MRQTKPWRRDKRVAAFALKELLVIIAVTFVLVALAFSYAAKAKANSRKIACVNNLKRAGLSFDIFLNDLDDKSPTGVSINKGGSMEYEINGEVFRHFRAMSNYLSTTKVLICPADNRKPAFNFSVLSNANISYFVAADSADRFPRSLFAGDRNLMTNGVAVGSGLLVLTTKVTLGWTAAQHKHSGNVVLGDGSVQQFTSALLQEQSAHSGVATNRLLIP